MIREELRPLYYSGTVFVIATGSKKSEDLCEDDLSKDCSDWLLSIDEDGCSFLRSLMLLHCSHDWCGKMDEPYWRPEVTPMLLEISESGGGQVTVFGAAAYEKEVEPDDICNRFLFEYPDAEETSQPPTSPLAQVLMSSDDHDDDLEFGRLFIKGQINVAPRAAVLNDLGIPHVLFDRPFAHQPHIARLIQLTKECHKDVFRVEGYLGLADPVDGDLGAVLENWSGAALQETAETVVDNEINGVGFDKWLRVLLEGWSFNTGIATGKSYKFIFLLTEANFSYRRLELGRSRIVGSFCHILGSTEGVDEFVIPNQS